MDQRVRCPGCNQPQSRKNISRHLKLCKKMIDLKESIFFERYWLQWIRLGFRDSAVICNAVFTN